MSPISFKGIKYFTTGKGREINLGAATTFIIKVSGMAFGYLITLLIAKLYTPETVGNFISAFLLLEFIIVVSLCGMSTAVVVLVSRHQLGDRQSMNAVHFTILRKALSVTMPMTILGSVILYALSDTVAVRGFHSETLSHFLRIMAWGIPPVAASRLIAQYVRGCKNIPAFSVINFLLMNIALLALIFILHLNHWGSAAVPYAYFFGSVMMLLAAIVFVHRQANPGGRLMETLQLFRSGPAALSPAGDVVTLHHLTAISKPIFFADIMEYAKAWGGVFLVGIFLTQHDVGIYGIGTKLAGFIGLYGLAYSSIITPMFGDEFRRGNWPHIEGILRYSAKMLTFFTLCSILILLLLGKPILGFLGPDYQSAFLIIIILCLGHLFRGFLGGGNYLLQAVNKQRQYTLILAANMALSIVMYFLLIPRFGINGAAASDVIFTCGVTVSLYLYIKRVVAINLLPFKA